MLTKFLTASQVTNQLPRATGVVGKERYQFKSYGPAATKYTVPYTFGTGSIDKTGGKSWSIGVSSNLRLTLQLSDGTSTA